MLSASCLHSATEGQLEFGSIWKLYQSKVPGLMWFSGSWPNIEAEGTDRTFTNWILMRDGALLLARSWHQSLNDAEGTTNKEKIKVENYNVACWFSSEPQMDSRSADLKIQRYRWFRFVKEGGNRKIYDTSYSGISGVSHRSTENKSYAIQSDYMVGQRHFWSTQVQRPQVLLQVQNHHHHQQQQQHQ